MVKHCRNSKSIHSIKSRMFKIPDRCQQRRHQRVLGQEREVKQPRGLRGPDGLRRNSISQIRQKLQQRSRPVGR